MDAFLTASARRCLHALLWFGLAVAPLPASASADHDLAALTRQLDAQIAQPRFAQARWGIAVVSLDSGRTLYAHAADKLFQPASTAKLFTAALVLATLDADYRIPTRLLAGTVRTDGRLDGPLILYGMGDPTLGAANETADWADQLARQLRARGITRVHGDLMADATYFQGPPIGDGWEAGDLQSGFAAPASALSVDENQFRLTVTPAAQGGGIAHLHVEPAVAAPPLADDIHTAAPGSGNDINLYRAVGAPRLHAFGRIDAGSAAQTFRLAVGDPAQIAGEALLQALARRGIGVDGQLRVLRWPQQDEALRAHAHVIAEVRSPPLRTILRQGLKRSQNLYLQNLLQLAGVRARADAARDPAAVADFRTSEAWGIRAEKTLLARIGITPATALIGEGTGLSRRDLVTPNALVRVLGYLAAQPDAATLRDMLPVAGVDGSLVARMRGTPAAGNVHAKTGSMTYVNCLAGYVTSAAGEHLAFAIMLNDYAAPADAPASRELDTLAELLAAWDERS